jgi:hypothetical protein
MSSSNGSVDTAEHDFDQRRASAVKTENNGREERQSMAASSHTQTDVSDIQAARGREQEIIQATGKQDWYLYALAAVVVVGFFAFTVAVMFTKSAEASKEIVFMLFGGLVTGFSMVLSYFFGSSAGSAQKTAQLAELAKSMPLSSKQSR